MKRLLAILLLCLPCLGQSPITITGTITDSSNNVATSGFIQFSLTPNNQGLPYSVPPSTTIASTSRCRINASGQPVNYITGVGACLVWPNDLILPANTLYQIQIAPASQVTRVYNNVLLASATNPQPLASLTFIQPQPVVGTVINGSPLVTMSIVPSNDLVWTLGQPNKRYVNIYAGTATIPSIITNNIIVTGTCTGCSSSPPDWANPGTIGSTTPNTGAFTTLSSSGLATLNSLSVTNGATFNGTATFNAVATSFNTNIIISNATFQTPAGGPFLHQLPAASGTYMATFTAGTGCGTFNTTTGALNLSTCAPLASPTLTGVPLTPTAAPGTNTTQIASTAFVAAAITAAGTGNFSSTYRNGSLITHTGTTTEDVIYSTTLPALGTNSQAYVDLTWDANSQDANASDLRFFLNGVQILQLAFDNTEGTGRILRNRLWLVNRNNTSSQIYNLEWLGCATSCPYFATSAITTAQNTASPVVFEVRVKNNTTAANSQSFFGINVLVSQ